MISEEVDMYQYQPKHMDHSTTHFSGLREVSVLLVSYLFLTLTSSYIDYFSNHIETNVEKHVLLFWKETTHKQLACLS